VDGRQQFTATVTGNSNQSVMWDVNGTVGGNGTVGFIDSISGLYTAPASVPSPSTVQVHATSSAASSAIGRAAVTITNPPPAVTVTISPTSASVRARQTKRFKATVQNASVTTVTWEVNGVAGGNSTVGKINPSGLYAAPNAVPSPATVTVTAVSTADPTKSASASVGVTRGRDVAARSIPVE
jgi:hypothetical protein